MRFLKSLKFLQKIKFAFDFFVLIFHQFSLTFGINPFAARKKSIIFKKLKILTKTLE
jgi:hypothetical protein